MAAILVSLLAGAGQAQSSPPSSGGSKGENFSNKPAPQLFNADCTGAGCHKSPQGLAKGQSQMGLAAFLREHYTNSRESAAALAAYIMRAPAGPPQPEPRAARATTARPPQDVPGGSWFDPEPGDPRALRQQPQQQPQQGGKPARAAARPTESKPTDAKPAEAKPSEAKPGESKPESKPETRPAEEPAAAAAEPKPAPAAEPKPAPAAQHRNPRGRQPAVAATPAAPAPAAEPAAQAAPAAPPAAARAAPPQQFDIFD